MKKFFTAIITVALISLFSACTTFQAEGLAVTRPGENDVFLGTFNRSVMVNEFLGTPGGTNLFNISANAMKAAATDLVWAEVTKLGGNAARDVEITYSANLFHYILNQLTWGIWAPAKINVKGTVIRTSSASNITATNAQVNNAVQNAISETNQ